MTSKIVNSASCVSCRLRREECVCAHAPRLSIATRLIVLIHSKEWRRTTNTGHFARLAVRGAEVRLHGSPKGQASSAGVEPSSSSTLVLYPGRGADPLSAASITSLPRPFTLLVPDGNWNQTKHMMRRLPMLAQARPVCLDRPGSAYPGLRRNRRPDRMSTFEAIAQALGILEGQAAEDDLLRFFRYVLDRMAHNSRRAAQRTEGP